MASGGNIEFNSTKNPDHYWASETNQKKLVGHCQDRSSEFKEAMKRTQLVDRVMRSWQYYHNLYYQESGASDGNELKALGESGEKVGASFNHYRSLMQSIITIVTGDRPAVDCLSVNSEIESIHQAEIGEDLCDYYLGQMAMEDSLRRSVEHAAVLTTGFTVVEWDNYMGAEVDADLDTDEIIYEGDIDIWNPSLFDVVYDVNVQEWSRQRWAMVRQWVNKWELIKKYPSKKKVILGIDAFSGGEWQWNIGRMHSEVSDMVSIWKLYHMPSPALPDGLEFSFIEDEPLGKPRSMRYKSLPVKRLMPAEILLTPFGYSAGFDMQGPQEALNAEMSAILTNHRMGAVNRLWVDSNSDVDYSMLSEDLALVQADTKPEVLQLGYTIPEIFKMADVIRQEMEFFSGVNSVFRGQPEASLKSGTALALIDAKAVQYNSIFTAAYQKHLEECCQQIIEILQDFPNPSYDRVYAIAGKHKRHQLRSFRPSTIERIKRVQVRATSALMKTLSGRLELSTLLIQNNMIRNPSQLLTVIETGNIDPLTESETAQLSGVRQENSDLLEGLDLKASTLDDHVLHIREHASIANSPDFRRDEERMANLHAHISGHLELINDPGSQMIQVLLGYQAPIQASPQPAPKGASPLPSKTDTPLPGMSDPNQNNNGGAQQPRMPQPAVIG